MVEGLDAQVRQVLDNMKAIVEEAGGSMSSIVKCTVLLQSMDDFKAMNAIYAEYFGSDPPARAAFEVAALPLGALVEIEAIALLG
jgi:2-iminobutanoate/2-iminopropanoate deaminase